MLDIIRPSPYGAAERAMTGCDTPIPLRKKLEQRKAQLEQVLAEVNDGLAALDANPDLEKFLGVMSKTGVRV